VLEIDALESALQQTAKVLYTKQQQLEEEQKQVNMKKLNHRSCPKVSDMIDI